jgi:hypothetical protein
VTAHPPNATPEVPPGRPATAEFVDVWSRSGPRYRVRAILLLTVNILLFSGAACFTYWLRSGEFFAPTREGYLDSIAQTFSGVGNPDVSLAAFLVEPISIDDVPMQIPIVGLLMAALISVPILVAILYRFWSSLPFIVIIGLVAVMPWLAITLLACCMIASVRPFRTRIRFMSAMLALIPAIVYLVLAWSGTKEVVVGRVDPIDRIKFVAPWVLAIVASALVFAVVLAIARIVNYRPGAVTPLLALMFAIPVLLFEASVGRDELYYRLLVKLDQAAFADQDARLGLLSAAQADWEYLPRPSRARSRSLAMNQEDWLFQIAPDLHRCQAELIEKKAEVRRRCAWFQHQYPYSPHACNVLLIDARAAQQRLDVPEFKAHRWIRYYDAFPHPETRPIWEKIAHNEPDSPMAALALLKLSQLDAQACDTDRARSRLDSLWAKFQPHFLTRAPAVDEPFLSRPAEESGMNINLAHVLLQAAWLRDLIQNNAGDENYRSDPLCGAQRGRPGTEFGLLDLDPRDESYGESVNKIMQAFPQALLMDNLELERAKLVLDPGERATALGVHLERFPQGDAAPEAMLRQAMALREIRRMDEAGLVLERLMHEHPQSVWAGQCRELRLPGPPARGTANR